MSTGIAKVPFAEIADPPAIYELSVWLRFAYDNYHEDAAGDWPPVVSGAYTLACGREDGRWRMKVSPIIGDDDALGPTVVNLSDQTGGPDPLALLRALLSGLEGIHDDQAAMVNIGLRIGWKDCSGLAMLERQRRDRDADHEEES